MVDLHLEEEPLVGNQLALHAVPFKRILEFPDHVPFPELVVEEGD